MVEIIILSSSLKLCIIMVNYLISSTFVCLGLDFLPYRAYVSLSYNAETQLRLTSGDSPAVGSRTQHSLIKFFSLLIINVWDLYDDI